MTLVVLIMPLEHLSAYIFYCIVQCCVGTLYIRRRNQLLREKSAEWVFAPLLWHICIADNTSAFCYFVNVRSVNFCLKS